MKHLLFLRCRLPSCNLSRKNNKIESESQLVYKMFFCRRVVTYPVKIIKLKANHNLVDTGTLVDSL